MWILYAAASAVCAGVTTIFLKKGVHTTNTNVALALRTVVVLIYSIVIVLIVGSQNQIYNIDSRTWLFLFLSGLSTGAGWYYYYKALQFGNVNKVSPLSKGSLVLTILLSFIFLHEEITINKLFGVVVITIGTYFMIDYKKSKSEIQDFAESSTEMFGGKKEEIEAICHIWLLDTIFETFGRNVTIEKIQNDEEHFKLKVDTNPLGFKMWAMRNIDLVEVKKPLTLRNELKDVIKKAMMKYEIEKDVN